MTEREKAVWGFVQAGKFESRWTLDELAERIKISRQSLEKRLKNPGEFRLAEIWTLVDEFEPSKSEAIRLVREEEF